ncbi:patatin-like phospholipase family protein [Hymenobacter properus]|uniref:Patatin-like phospholipase family protein n=1 Tax=Hymenobacter properus TaxID=2791026 RepID=A0A931BLA7_9BACT|nr:patatin-like phospholipase family protein [Hymenobacter properus]MBF9141550.1 patatin-like phospholipase family protein [Hymenobacter properus]MBR7720359.1 patatin-like phospholipase family protein [Microvirga sp. SRT04]
MAQFCSRMLLALLLAGVFRFSAQAQKVGVVLSGGGAKGLAHIGVLKQLEKNHIPIDYIVGTSMGAVVGGMYAAGYSPEEIEQIVLTPEFQRWTSGKPLESKTFNFLTAEPSPSALRLGIAIDSTFKARVSTNLVNDLNLNLALTRMLAPASASSGYNFDKLFVPFRCMASEVFTRQVVEQKSGSLSDAIRNSMAFPLAFRPIRNLDGKYYYDGAVYDNFPTNTMKKTFAPDIIIGVNVGDVAFKKYPKNDDQLLASTVAFLGTSVADTGSVGKNGIYIQPDLDGMGVGDFDRVKDFIAEGDTAALRNMEKIKARIGRRVDSTELQKRRLAFQALAPKPRFIDVKVNGLRPDQNEYAARFFRKTGREYTLDDLEEGYYRLASDDYFKNIYPRIRYDAARQGYVFSVDAQRNNNVSTELGFVLSNRPIDNLYFGLEYRYLRRLLYTASADVSLGRFYNGAHGSFRISVPAKYSYFIEPEVTYNQWDYQNTGGLLGRDVLSTQVRQQDTKLGGQFGISPTYRSRLLLDLATFVTKDEYTNSKEINSADVLDATVFRGATAALRLARNTLNRKQYATSGHRYVYTLRGVTGEADYTPGSTGQQPGSSTHHEWLQFRATVERYFVLKGDRHAWGYFAELMASSQGTFSNYRSSQTTAPVFAPLPDTRTLFLDSYRSARYGAVGLRYTQPFLKKLEWRSEVYVHVNAQPLKQGEQQVAVRQSGLDRPRLTASTGLIFQTPVGPLAVHARFYDDPAERFGVYGHLGFLLFRSRALE